MPALSPPDPPLPPIVTMHEALSAGLTRDQVRQRVRSGRWTRLAHGVYQRGTPPGTDTLDDFARARLDHAHRAIGAALAHPGAVIVGPSAAVLHGLPLFSPLPERVWLVQHGYRPAQRTDIDVHDWRLGPTEVEQHRVPVTSAVRTWLDIARLQPLSDGLAVGDALLRSRVGISAEVRASIDARGSIRGIRRARLAADHIDGARETPLESGSWAYFVEHRVALPAMQHEIRSRDGRFVGRVDFWWRHAGVVGECDGRLKYTDRADLYAEKRREDALRELGLTVVRWGWQDLRGEALAQRLRRVLA